ncbi:helix-turn-helix domain-containing protein [Pseudogracilibacillus auburnensis]|uniref:XRE family transcriptional regulator n=1 Tax=Pseudogracilibacillus auburnensis TaxID=1494959 RepID=A0A2V3VT47_9BACI|nr:XRE family transcriptional regulator [Pseudogracilibacillus auburnensis]MBO1004311.1 helix-turn-helix transcriptional regulator [Pseudogracilibacillus auburnensis]PXW85063.1 XRE family transcriptional regulator [Pseudogracilibacillus auburnensis]
MKFGINVKRIRRKKNLTLEELADRSKVSRSMLSMIERGEKNPTIQVASQIAEGLEVTISYLLGEQEKQEVIFIRENERLVYKDETSGVERHLLSPSFSGKGLEFILHILPPLQSTGTFPAHRKGVKECIHVTHGKLQIELGEQPKIFVLEKGDSIYFEADLKHRLTNLVNEECQFYLIIDSHQIV